jgi:hypothetical protein
MSVINLGENSKQMKKPTMSPVEYAKMILEKVSFEPRIFKKELRKALKKASKRDFKHLITWCREKFRKE